MQLCLTLHCVSCPLLFVCILKGCRGTYFTAVVAEFFLEELLAQQKLPHKRLTTWDIPILVNVRAGIPGM